MKQIAKRVYNNNVVLSENASGEEIIGLTSNLVTLL